MLRDGWLGWLTSEPEPEPEESRAGSRQQAGVGPGAWEPGITFHWGLGLGGPSLVLRLWGRMEPPHPPPRWPSLTQVD